MQTQFKRSICQILST